MKAKTICPYCKEEIIEICEACIKFKELVHLHKNTKRGKEGIPDFYENIKWEIIE